MLYFIVRIFIVFNIQSMARVRSLPHPSNLQGLIPVSRISDTKRSYVQLFPSCSSA